MNKTFKALSLAVVLLALAGFSFAQTSLTQTTLAASISNGPVAAASGLTGSYQTQINLASNAGVTVALNGQPVTFIYVDQELFGVLTQVVGQTTLYNVLRAVQGTKASPHASGTMALIENVQPLLGGYSGSGGFQATDPPFNGACSGPNTLVTPWVNIITAAQWICSTITGTWVPGWNNPLTATSPHVTTAVASAAGLVTPSGPLFHITGTSAITGFNIPVGFNATAEGGGCFTVIPDAVFTYTAANNIGLASTGLNAGTAVVVVNQPITFCWDATNSKFLPNTQ